MATPYSDTIELGHVARTIARGWRAIVVCLVLAIAVALAMIRYAPRQFTATSTILFRDNAPSAGSSILAQVSGLSDVTGGLLGGKSLMDTELEILGSQSVLGAAIDTLLLQAQLKSGVAMPSRRFLAAFSAGGSFKPYTLHFVRSGDHYDVTDGGVKATMTPGTPLQLGFATATFNRTDTLPAEFDMVIRDREDAITWINRHLKIDKKRGEVASISYAGPDSLSAALLPNTLIDVYMTRRKGTDKGINQRRVEFLSAKSDTMDRELARAAGALRRQQETSGVLDPATVAKVELESGAALQSKLTDVMVEQGALQQLMAQIRSNTATPRQLAAYPSFLHSQTINDLVQQLSDLQTKRTLLLKDRTEGDVEVAALKKSADDVEKQLMPYAETYASSIAKQRHDLEASLDSLNSNMAKLPKASESAALLQRDVLDLSKMSSGLQAQIVEAKLAAIGEGGDVRPLDAAIPPKAPSFPNPPLIIGVAIFGGLFCGLILALLVGSTGKWMRDAVQIERSTGVPALEFDPTVPLMISNGSSRTIIVAPIDAALNVAPVVKRLAQTAASRSISAAVLELPENARDVNGSIGRLESEHELVIVQLPSLVSDTAAAALQHGRPVFLVTPGRRIDRKMLMNAVQMLRRIEVPVAGIVMSERENGDRRLPR